MSMNINILVAGATGLVGSTMFRLLESRAYAASLKIYPVASERSKGKQITFRNQKLDILLMEEALEVAGHAGVALFSAGSAFSMEWAPVLAQHRMRVIDNSSAWRMHQDVPLIVPEINPAALQPAHHIIANPNCSTIQMVMALKPLHDMWGLREVVVSTYQAVTGTGYKAVKQLEEERKGQKPLEAAYPYPIDLNLIPQVDIFLDDGFTKEELKMRQESRKIMNLQDLKIAATCVRVPVMGGHSESVAATFGSEVSVQDAREALRRMPGVCLMDDPSAKHYPMPLYCNDRDEVFVGRLRKDPDDPKRLHLWIVADNLRKGAATNAIQILELLIARGWA